MIFHTRTRIQTLILSILFISMLTACRLIQPSDDDGMDLAVTEEPAEGNFPEELVAVQGQIIRQWAVEAVASTEYASPEWSAMQATGPPDTNRCGDYQTAWATAGSDSKGEWIELSYQQPVYVTGINIVQSFNPNQVVTVELIGAFGRAIEVYNNSPTQVDRLCPYTLIIPTERTESKFDKLRIKVDQSKLGLGWNQIDAVELIGVLN
jgi:hypothetical protein